MKFNSNSIFLVFSIFISHIKYFKSESAVCLPTSKCNGSIPCSENGHCFYDLKLVFNSEFDQNSDPFINCICDKGYTDDPKLPSIKCCYKKKSQFAAFLLETILGFGVGHFFIENYTLGVIKLCFQVTACCSCCLIGFCFCYKSNKHNEEPSNKQIFLNIAFLSGILIYMIWQTVDLVLFGINFYKDGNGVELETW